MSWPDRNYQFSRPWSPPDKRNPALAGTSNRADFVTSSETDNTALDRTVQRAIACALRRASELEALGLGHQADELREVAA